MDFQTLSNAISTIGFPILACIAMYKMNLDMKDALDHNTDAITDLSRKIAEQSTFVHLVDKAEEKEDK